VKRREFISLRAVGSLHRRNISQHTIDILINEFAQQLSIILQDQNQRFPRGGFVAMVLRQKLDRHFVQFGAHGFLTWRSRPVKA
jgi:hypothetical protein